MAEYCGKNVRVYVQMGEKMLEISGDVGEINFSYPPIETTMPDDIYRNYVPGMAEVSMNIVGSAQWSLADDFVREKRKPAEWKCEFCGHINPMKARYCGHKDRRAVGCGARRSFVLDL